MMNLIVPAMLMLHAHMFFPVTAVLKRDIERTENEGTNSDRRSTHRTSQIHVAAINCEYQEDPIGIDAAAPRLGWSLIVIGDQRGLVQTAYQIQVASSLQHLLKNKSDIWDSGVIDTIQSHNVTYKGKVLKSSARYYWRVRVRDNHGNMSSWSKPGAWEMGLLNKADWEGIWIGAPKKNSSPKRDFYADDPAPLFRREFLADQKIRKATLYVSGLGYYEAYLNGSKVGKNLLDPAWTNYDKHVMYRTHDVTNDLKAGKNCIGVMLGNGWYDPLPLKMWGRRDIRDALAIGQPRFIAQLNIEYADGSTARIASDKNWSTAAGPILHNSIYLGEKYDARLDIPGWNQPGTVSNDWKPVSVMDAPKGALCAAYIPPIIAGDTLSPVSIRKIAADRYIIDFGRNFAGIVRFTAQGNKGQQLSLKYGELLYPDGNINVMTSVAGQIKKKGVGGEGSPDTAYAKDIFILSGKDRDVFQPHFTFHGFRYVEISGYTGKLEKDDIMGLALYSDVKPAGTFSCSNSLFNKIQEISLNTFTSNIFSVQSDCPQRERFGYGGDIVATSEAFILNYDMSRFYEKTVIDFADDARADGGLTETAPFVGIAAGGLGGKSGPVEWGAALPILMHQLYQYYGNIELIRDQYQVAKNWVDFMHKRSKGNIIPVTIGDHESLDEKLVDLSATAYYYYNTKLLARFAALLGKQQDEIYYHTLKDSIAQTFQRHFSKTPDGKMGIGTAAAQAYALYFGLTPEGMNDKVLDIMLQQLRKKDDHITAGIFGTKLLLNVLGETGNMDIAWRMASHKTYPGWGYMIDNGATTLWEVWAFSDNVYSHNHPMFGSISEWFYKYVGGIRPSEDAAGFNDVVIKPYVKQLQWANTTYRSVLGNVSCNWTLNGQVLTMNVEIPVNMTARIHIPAALDQIKENGLSLSNHKDIRHIGMEMDHSVFELKSGSYQFSVTMK